MAINKDTGLTDKQERFCQEYLIDLNGTKAAKRAGYAKNSCNEQAARMLAKDSIILRLNELKKNRAKTFHITQQDVLNELTKIGFSNIQEYLNGDLSIKDLMKIESDKSGAIGSIKRNIYTTAEGDVTENVEFKLHDKLKALEMLSRHLGIFEADNKRKIEIEPFSLKETINNFMDAGDEKTTNSPQ